LQKFIATYHSAYNSGPRAFFHLPQGLLALDVVFVVEALPVLFPVGVVVIVSGFLDMRQIGDFWRIETVVVVFEMSLANALAG
jgi:hypothetical protein